METNKAKMYSLEEIDDILKTVGVKAGYGQKHDPASTSMAGVQTPHGYHGFGSLGNVFGVFGRPGVRPEMYSAMARPMSLMSVLTPEPSEFTDEIYEIMTGQTASAGTNAADFCGNPPGVGDLKTCQQVYKFGEYFVKTNLVSLPHVGERRDRRDIPRNILNSPAIDNPFLPDLVYKLDDSLSQLRFELFKVGADVERTLSKVAITGDISQASASTEVGWIKEFTGLDLQVKTGYTDIPTGITCPAADSMVINYGVDVGATIAGGDGRNLVQTFHDLYYAAQQRARGVNMEGVVWAFVGRSEAFRSIVERWACDYATYRCTTGTAGNPVSTDAQAAGELRIEMMSGQYLLIDGAAIPFLFDEGVPQGTPSANTLESDVFLVPLSWNGVPLLRLEYKKMDNEYTTEFATTFGIESEVDYLNNGMYMVGKRSAGLCLEFLFAAKMRMVLDTPFLAGRVDNVRYTFNAPIHNALPGSSYHYDGGVTRTV